MGVNGTRDVSSRGDIGSSLTTGSPSSRLCPTKLPNLKALLKKPGLSFNSGPREDKESFRESGRRGQLIGTGKDLVGDVGRV
jgi:hypothetical protein